MKPGLHRTLIDSVVLIASSIVNRRILKNASALYASQFVNYLLPLVTVPYLARVLGPETWGVIILVQAIGLYANMVVEYFFEYSATRDVARERTNPKALGQIAAGVLGARLLLSAGLVSFLLLAQSFVPVLSALGWMLWLGVFWFVSMGFRPLWFFLGIERLGRLLAVEGGLKIVAVLGIFAFVNAPSDAWRVLAVQGVATFFAAVIGTIMLYRAVPLMRPSFSHAIECLRDGWDMFIFRASTSVYSMGNTLILGFVASPAAVSYYGAAERVIRMIVSLMFPIVQSMYPRASSQIVDDPRGAGRIARITTIGIFTLASIGAVVLYLTVPIIVRILLGPGYSEVVPVMRTLLLLLPILGIAIPLSSQWILPIGLESTLTKITISAGIIHVPLAIVLGSQFAHIGIAWALVATEAYITTISVLMLALRGHGTFLLPSRASATR